MIKEQMIHSNSSAPILPMQCYKQPFVELYNEDCLETLKRIETGSVDLMLTDPPYNVTQNEWDKPIDFDALWIEWHRTPSVECTAEMVHEYCKNTPELNNLLPKKLTLTTDESGNYLIKMDKGSTTKLSRNALDMLAFSDYYEAVGAHFQTNFPNLQLD